MASRTLLHSEPVPSSCIDSGDTTWVLVSTILVLGMMPALAFFEAGLLRAKNTLSIVSQIFGGLIALGFLWDIVGYSLVYGSSLGGFIGNPIDHIALVGVSYFTCRDGQTIPVAAFALFMMMFAAITPLLMTGSFAERINWRSFFILTVLWEILVYYPVAHWIWGGGWLAQIGVLDFAGGIVIHTSAGTGAFVLALIMGRRRGFDKVHGEFPPSNLPLAALGAALLWMGWFGFNAGSALTSGTLATSALASTQIAAVSSGMVWLVLSWVKDKPSTVAIINGVIAGLAGITPASGYISSQSSIVVGIILGLASYYCVVLFKHKLRIDDALDVSSVHGVTGMIGSISIGVCAQYGATGWIFGNPKLLGIQLLGVVVVALYSAVVTFLIGIILHKTLGLKVSEEDEAKGLDAVEHKEYAYHGMVLNRYDHHQEEEEIQPIFVQ